MRLQEIMHSDHDDLKAALFLQDSHKAKPVIQELTVLAWCMMYFVAELTTIVDCSSS